MSAAALYRCDNAVAVRIHGVAPQPAGKCNGRICNRVQTARHLVHLPEAHEAVLCLGVSRASGGSAPKEEEGGLHVDRIVLACTRVHNPDSPISYPDWVVVSVPAMFQMAGTSFMKGF